MRISDWGSDGCSSDLLARFRERVEPVRYAARQAGAIVDRQLARRGPLGHHLQRGIAVAAEKGDAHEDRTSVGEGKRVVVRVDLGGCLIIYNNNDESQLHHQVMAAI